MRLPEANPLVLQRATFGFHVLQALMIPITMGVTGASMLQAGSANSSTKYMFAMCWLTIPALIYVTMTPRFQRTKPLANPFAICGFNCVFTFFWFIAPIALGVANTKSQVAGRDARALVEEDFPKDTKPSCETALFPKECSLNSAAVGLGVFMFLFLTATSITAIYVAIYYRIHLITPWEAHSGQIGGEQVIEHTKHAFGDDESQGGDYALVAEDDRMRQNTPYGGHGRDSVYDEDYERQLARDGEDQRSKSVGSGSYDVGRVGFPDGDYTYTAAGK